MRLQTTPLRHLAEVRVSNVDKKSAEGQSGVSLCNYTDVYYSQRITRSMEFMAATATARQIRDFTLRAGDTLITKDSETAEDIGVAAFVPQDLPGVVCGYHLALIRPRAGTDGRYLSWAVQSGLVREQWAVSATGVTRYGLNYGAIRETEVPLPPLEEQRRIADFLDDQVTRIDHAIQLRQRQRSALREEQTALLDHLLVSPRDPLVRLSWVARLQSGLALNSADDANPDKAPRPYLRVANVKADRLDLTEIKVVLVSPDQIRRHQLRDGDVLMTEGGDRDKLGRGTVWRCEIPEALHQNHIFALRCNRERLLPDFLALLTQTTPARRYFEATGNQSTNLASTTASNVLAWRLGLPDLAEQHARVESGQRAIASIDLLARAIVDSIGLLVERKRSLITAAVTGEFDVSTASSRAANQKLSGSGVSS